MMAILYVSTISMIIYTFLAYAMWVVEPLKQDMSSYFTIFSSYLVMQFKYANQGLTNHVFKCCAKSDQFTYRVFIFSKIQKHTKLLYMCVTPILADVMYN